MRVSALGVCLCLPVREFVCVCARLCVRVRMRECASGCVWDQPGWMRLTVMEGSAELATKAIAKPATKGPAKLCCDGADPNEGFALSHDLVVRSHCTIAESSRAHSNRHHV